MATKNLARTVIEGGRARFNQFERRHSSRVERACFRAHESRILHDLDVADAETEPIRKPVQRAFHDKLGPAYRFLSSRVGRPWNETHALLFARFDTRTTAGRHILFDHLLRSVTHESDPARFRFASRYDYYIDADGILQRPLYRRKRVRPRVDWRMLTQWLDQRRVGRVGEVLFWFVPTRPVDVKITWNWDGRLIYSVRKVVDAGALPSYRQHARLARPEIVFFDSLPKAVQTELLKQAPVPLRQTFPG
jgi:hypothetical protein